MRWIQKIVQNGTSAQVTIPRALMNRLRLRPGRFVEIVHDEESVSFAVREWADRDNATLRSPGLITPAPELPR